MRTAVCFDLFETLVTEFVADYRPSPSVAERLEIDPIQFGKAWTQLTPARFRGELSDFYATLREICRQAGKEAPEALIAQLHAERTRQKARPFITIDPDIMAMLRKLQQRGLKLAVVSNASAEEVEAWSNSDLAPYFTAAIFSFQVGRVKPEPEIYWSACEALQVAPASALFVGDGSSDELRGAQQAGLKPYWATWFIDRWPFTNQSSRQKQQSEQFVRLATPTQLIEVVEKQL